MFTLFQLHTLLNIQFLSQDKLLFCFVLFYLLFYYFILAALTYNYKTYKDGYKYVQFIKIFHEQISQNT